MKRELAQILDGKSPVSESLGRTRSSQAESAARAIPLVGVSEAPNLGSSSKRHKACVVDGVTVYTRGRKTRSNVVEGEDSEAERAQKSSVGPETQSKKHGVEEFKESELVEVLVEEDSKVASVSKDKMVTEQQSCADRGALEVPVLLADDIRRVKSSPQVALKRFTRSALKPKEELAEERDMETALVVFESNSAPPNLDGESEYAAAGLPATPSNKLELKMSKKIVLNKKPTTVKELFDTGLVDGVPVVYMGGKKASGLRGTIRDGGILCSCAVCNGCRVSIACYTENL